ncbi:hypothetical protein OG921_22180 [Aldersonia sp. NBC_00410]|uniref:hypothetical protein n=1 Tax=Aldersonia sp. NBC_00410 TaxID=2975954 RepID=UPI002256F10E|nr:hypothetical protein [Aldersonia sp. NBC_00410]MCX5045880.1 hypothetical protein [Aldersonia sp. NBC_00410]
MPSEGDLGPGRSGKLTSRRSQFAQRRRKRCALLVGNRHIHISAFHRVLDRLEQKQRVRDGVRHQQRHYRSAVVQLCRRQPPGRATVRIDLGVRLLRHPTLEILPVEHSRGHLEWRELRLRRPPIARGAQHRWSDYATQHAALKLRTERPKRREINRSVVHPQHMRRRHAEGRLHSRHHAVDVVQTLPHRTTLLPDPVPVLVSLGCCSIMTAIDRRRAHR